MTSRATWPASRISSTHDLQGNARRDAVAVNRDFDRVGAKHNAQTSEEDTFYHVTCLPEYLPQAFDVLSDILRPSLRTDDFETEKQVIIEEIRMYLDNPMSVAYEAAKAAHFGSHPLGNSILGTVDSITALRAEQMREYFTRRYSPHNIVLAFAGNSDWDSLFELAKSHCSDWQGDAADRVTGPVARSRLMPGHPPRRRPATDCCGCLQRPAAGKRRPLRGPPAGDHHGRPHRLAALLDLDRSRPGRRRRTLLPGLQSGRRFLLVSELRAFAKHRQTSNGSLKVYHDAIANGVTEEELLQAKNKVLARSVLRSERPMGRLASLGFHWMYRHAYLSIEQELEAFNQVTVDDLRRLLADWPLWPLDIVSVGPTTEIKMPD